MIRKSWFIAGACSLFALPAQAHHGKDFLLIETDDVPLPHHVYALGSLDANIGDGARSTEITPGLLFGVGNRVALEPHFHVTREGGDRFRYEATAFEARVRLGNIARSEWRLAASAEIEQPRDREEHANGGARLIFARTFPQTMVAINVLAGRTFNAGEKFNYGFGLEILKPLSNGNRAGIEVLARLPLRDGIEIVPGYYAQLGASGQTALKLGVGFFHSRERDASTLHVQVSQRF